MNMKYQKVRFRVEVSSRSEVLREGLKRKMKKLEVKLFRLNLCRPHQLKTEAIKAFRAGKKEMWWVRFLTFLPDTLSWSPRDNHEALSEIVGNYSLHHQWWILIIFPDYFAKCLYCKSSTVECFLKAPKSKIPTSDLFKIAFSLHRFVFVY